MITKVEYGARHTVVHFRCVANAEKEIIRFFGSQHERAWHIISNQRANSNEIFKRPADISNIRLNDNRIKEELGSQEVAECQAQRGDIISCEIVFDNLPHYVRSISLVGGETDKTGADRFPLKDLQIKTQASPMLGDKTQMQTLIEGFYRQQKTVRYPSILEVTTLQQDSIFSKEQKRHAAAASDDAITNAARPIDYMPRILQSVSDLNCHERFILQNVYFDDDKTEFSRRAQAIKTITMIAEHLQRYPDAKVALHGHTDIFGDQYNNLLLSEKRVMAVLRVLTEKGIDRKRIIINFYGGTHPLPLYKDGGHMNRRVEAEIICPKQ